jgi:hypothetical protein
MPSLNELLDELNHVAEYARINVAFEIEEGVEPNLARVTLRPSGDIVVVDIPWALGNVRRLPDKTSYGQIVETLSLSHPKIKGVGPSAPPTVY